jgi:hypothetical protein
VHVWTIELQVGTAAVIKKRILFCQICCATRCFLLACWVQHGTMSLKFVESILPGTKQSRRDRCGCHCHPSRANEVSLRVRVHSSSPPPPAVIATTPCTSTLCYSHYLRLHQQVSFELRHCPPRRRNSSPTQLRPYKAFLSHGNLKQHQEHVLGKV